MSHIRLDRARKLLNCKYSILVVDDKKRPLHKWKDFQTFQISQKQLEKEIENFDAWRFGYATGYENVFCVDVDLKVLHQEDRKKWFNEFIEYLRDSIDGFDKKVSVHATLNYGYHLTYRAETDMGNEKLAVPVKTGIKPEEGKSYEAVIETRGKGGYAILYDDCYNGLDYTEIQYLTKEEHDTIISICKMYDERPEEIELEEPTRDKPEFQQNGITPWQDYEQKHSVLDVVGDEFKVVRNLSSKIIIKRHGATSAHSGYIYKDSGCMYLFTTGTQYPNQKLLSSFHCYAWKHHNGNFSEAASQLYKDGYGDRIKPKEQPKLEHSEEVIKRHSFPIDIFPTTIREYILACNETLGHSVDFMGSGVLWVGSLIIGNSIKVELKTGYTECCSLWIAVVGSAGVGKTPAVKDAIRPLIEMNKRAVRDYSKAKKEFDEYSALSDQEKNNHAEVMNPSRKQFVVNDTTIEALIELHEENPNSVGVFKDELAGWVKEMNKYRAGADLEFWLSTFSNSFASTNRKTVSDSYIDSPIIPVLGGIQPNVMSKLFTEDFRDNGFTDRLLLSYPDHKPPKWNYNEMDSDLIAMYDDFILSLYGHIKSNLVVVNEDGDIDSNYVRFEPDAKEKLGELMDNLTDMQTSDDVSENLKSVIPKMKTYLPRFAIILHILSCHDDGVDYVSDINIESLNNAQRLVDYFVSMNQKVSIDSIEFGKLKQSSIKPVKSDIERFLAMYEVNPKLKNTDAARILNVSERTIRRWKKELEEQK